MVSAPISCACGCGTPIQPVDSRGRERRYRVGHAGRNCWSTRDVERLLVLSERGLTDAQIARTLKRTQAAVVQRRVIVNRRLGHGDQLTTTEVARIFGVTSTGVRAWIRRGWLGARESGWLRYCKGELHRAWTITSADVESFMRDQALWVRWWPEDMPPGHWRDVALELRAGLTFLTTSEVGDLLGYTSAHVGHLIADGRLRGVRGCARFPSGRKGSRAWYVRSDWMPRSAAEIAA